MMEKKMQKPVSKGLVQCFTCYLYLISMSCKFMQQLGTRQAPNHHSSGIVHCQFRIQKNIHTCRVIQAQKLKVSIWQRFKLDD